MPATRRRLLVLMLVLVAAAVLPASPAGAAAKQPQLQLGPYNPAYVEALHDPLVKLGLGRLPSPVEVTVTAATEARAARRAFPSAFDLRDVEGTSLVTSPVKDQEDKNTCWAFANIAALESTILSGSSQNLDLSEDNLVKRSGFLSSQAQRYNYGGYDFMAVAYFARWAGPLNDADDPYPSGTRKDLSSKPTGPVRKHIQGVVMIPGRSGDLDNDLIKQLVTENGGVSVGMWADWTSWAGYWKAATDSYYCPNKVTRENHGVVIVGWDDDYLASNFKTEPEGNGAFLVRNSYGASWGDDGYFWVSYYDEGFARKLGLGTYGGCTSYSVVENAGNYSRNYGYDKLGVTDRLGVKGSRVIWAASRFTAASTKPITAVGFYTLSSGTTYQVWAGGTMKTLKYRGAGTLALPGYHTVKLKTAMFPKKGRKFIVAIRLQSPDSYYPLAIERRVWNSVIKLAPASAKAGQTYVGPKRWRMVDITKQKGLGTASVCLKAFARK